MKPGIAVWFPASALVAGLIFAVSSFAQSGSYNSTNTTTALANSNAVASVQPGTTTESSGRSWEDSASKAADTAEVATEKTYNHAARDIKDISLETRITAVLHENKPTRDCHVGVMADNGIVTLTGQVPSELNARRVQELVASVYGVHAVYSHLNYPHTRGVATAPDADSTGTAHPAYSDTAPAENLPAH